MLHLRPLGVVHHMGLINIRSVHGHLCSCSAQPPPLPLPGTTSVPVPALLRARVAGAAAVLVKSNWYYVPDEFMRTFAADWGLANVALQVAGSQPPPAQSARRRAGAHARSLACGAKAVLRGGVV